MGGSCHGSHLPVVRGTETLPSFSEFADCGVTLWVVGEGDGNPSPPRGRPPGGRAPAQSPGVQALAGMWSRNIAEHESLQEGDRPFLTALFQRAAADSSLVGGRWTISLFVALGNQSGSLGTSSSAHCYPSRLIIGLPPGAGRWAGQLSLT